jgi:hypothetical protein
MPPRICRWSRHGLPHRLLVGSSDRTRANAWSVSSNIIVPALLTCFQERDATELHAVSSQVRLQY